MPRIINAYADGQSSIADSLSKLGEAIYGDQAKNEVFRQKAFGQKNINDLAIDGTVGLDDPRLAKAQLAIGGNASGTFAGQGRALANDRWTNAATNAAGERNNVRNNAETHYSTDRRYDSDIATTGMNNDTSIKTTGMNNQTQRDIQLGIDARTLTPVDDGNGGYVYATKSSAVGQGAPMTTDQVKAGVISQALRKRADTMTAQPGGFPVNGAAPYNVAGPNTAPAAMPAQPAAPQGDIFAGLTPQLRALVGVNTEQPMVDPRTGRTGISRDNGTTLENGQPAKGYMNTSAEGALAQERDNNVRTQAGNVLPPAPTVYPDVAKDAALTSGLKSAGQAALNETGGLLGLGEPFPAVNRARENLINEAQATRELIASAPGRAAVMDKKWADKLIPQPGILGMTGLNADEQKNRSVQLTNHLRDMYTIVQQDAVNPNTPPAERVKMEAYLRNLGHAIQLREKVTPEAGAPAQPAAVAPRPRATNPATGQSVEWDGTAWVAAAQ